jgi:hypothetical protein
LANLFSRAEIYWLFDRSRLPDFLAQGIEAASAGETTKIGSTEGESPVRDSECAHKGSATHQGNDDD